MTEDDPPVGDDDDETAPLSRWWKPHAEVYQRRKLEPYRPARLKDGSKVTAIVNGLEERLDVDITFRVVNPQEGRRWSVLVDGTEVGTVTRVRREKGHTHYDITADDFTALVESVVDEQ